VPEKHKNQKLLIFSSKNKSLFVFVNPCFSAHCGVLYPSKK